MLNHIKKFLSSNNFSQDIKPPFENLTVIHDRPDYYFIVRVLTKTINY